MCTAQSTLCFASQSLMCKCRAGKFPIHIYISLITNHEDPEVGRNDGLPSSLWHSAQLGRQRCQLYAAAAFTPSEIPPFLSLLEAEWKPGLLNADKSRSLENFNYWDSNPEPLITWQSASTDCSALFSFLPIGLKIYFIVFILYKNHTTYVVLCLGSIA